MMCGMRPHTAIIRVYNSAGKVIETHERIPLHARVVIYSNIQRGFVRQRTFATWLVSFALAVSASAPAQTSTDTTGKKTPAVQTAESQAAMTPASALEKLKKGNARFVEKNMRSRDWLAK